MQLAGPLDDERRDSRTSNQSQDWRDNGTKCCTPLLHRENLRPKTTDKQIVSNDPVVVLRKFVDVPVAA
jgi:hypothetical protein